MKLTALVTLAAAALLAVALALQARPGAAQGGPTLLDSRLTLTEAASGLELPTTMAFIGPNDAFVLEKNTGKVQRLQWSASGVTKTEVLDLGVNNASERGLLGIALDPNFAAN